MGSSRKWLKLNGSKKRLSSVNTDAASVYEKPSRWKLWKLLRLVHRKSACTDKDAGEKKGVGDGETNVERAAICIQTAFRGFLAKRALRALKGLMRLQAAISGHDCRNQSAASLYCIQAFVRVQARIHRERAIKSRNTSELPQQNVTDPSLQACTALSEAEWCNALGTVEEIQAKEQQKQVAAIKRDRAIAYAFCNKWKANVKVNPGSLFDHDLYKSTWIWLWLDEWLNGLPKKESIHGKQGTERRAAKGSVTLRYDRKRTVAVDVRDYLNTKVSPSGFHQAKRTPTRGASPGRALKARAGKGIKMLSLKPNSKRLPGKSVSQSELQFSKAAKRSNPK